MAGMSKADEYRANAAECQRMAKVARNERDRRTWLEMAQHWLCMIKPQQTAVDADGQPKSEESR